MPDDDPMPEGCPPEGHEPAKGTFFRLVAKTFQPGDVTDKGCWRKPYKVKGPMFGKIDDCLAHGISLFEDLEVLRAARELNPWAAGKAIAEIALEPDMGRTLETTSDVADGHHDWWTTPYDLHPAVPVIEGCLEEAS